MSNQLRKELPDFIKDQGFESYDEIYLKFQNDFSNFARKYHLEASKVVDIYQDAFIVFYENVISGKLTRLTSTLKTYIFSVGKYLILNEMKKNKKEVNEDYDLQIPDLEKNALDELLLTEEQQRIVNYIHKLGESCQKVLVYFYYHQHSIKEIQKLMNYNSENVTKSKKSQCLKTLRNLIHKNAV